jgi:tripartite-type tricarboxylate transporter receptor subunit TctC
VKNMIGCILQAALILGAVLGGSALAQEAYPSKPIRFIVPYPPGGGTDIVSRLITAKLSERLGVQVIVDNRGGAAGTIGVAMAAKGSPDGYTLVMGQTSNLSIGPALYRKLQYDALKDFAPVSLVDIAPLALSVSHKSMYKSVSELIAASKAKPDGLTFASPGNGTVAHLTGELLRGATKMNFVHVPYKGAAQAIPDLIAGRADFYISSLESAKPHMQAGTIRVLAITSQKRAPDAPDIPTIAEAGYKGFEAVTWWGVLAPAGTPNAIVKRLSDEIATILQSPEVNKRLGGDGVPTGPEEFAKVLKSDHAKWARIVKESGARVN